MSPATLDQSKRGQILFEGEPPSKSGSPVPNSVALHSTVYLQPGLHGGAMNNDDAELSKYINSVLARAVNGQYCTIVLTEQ